MTRPLILVLCFFIHEGFGFFRLGEGDPNSRNLMAGRSTRWPNGTVPYSLDSTLRYYYAPAISAAMSHIESKTCIRFVPRADEKIFLKIYSNDPKLQCYTTIGRSDKRPNIAHLRPPYCLQHGIIVHELLHALGFDHEHNRFDRDDYLTINWANIHPSGYSNFYKSKKKGQLKKPMLCGSESNDLQNCYNGYSFTTFGYPYDYGSIMHYGRTAYGYRNQVTMVPKNDHGQELGQIRGMSDLDIKKVNAAYCEGPTLEDVCVNDDKGCDNWKHACNQDYIQDKCEKACNVCVPGSMTVPRP